MAGVASLFFYIVVLVVSVTSVLFGLDWLSTPPPPRAKTPVQVVASTVKPPAPAPQAAKTSIKSEAPVQADKQVAKPAQAASAPPSAAEAAAAPSTGNPPAASAAQPATVGDAHPDMTTAAAAPASSPRCDVQACASRYRSFRASDCTWQPFEGPRRLCTKGKPAASAKRAAANATAAANRAQARACNVQACERAYASFDRADCTYQPYDGPRRYCAK